MKNHINSTAADTPIVSFDKESNTYKIEGNSYLENCAKFYDPVIKFIENYADSGQTELNLVFHYNLINSTSSVYVAQMAVKAGELKNKGVNINVSWIYDEDDEELLDLGQKLSSICKIDFTYKSIKD